MFKISHRGNVTGPDKLSENSPSYIEEAINLGFECEIDVHYFSKTNKIYLGHDGPQYLVNLEWLLKLKEKLWIHCKNAGAIEFFALNQPTFNFFWHQKDDFTLTSLGIIWAYPGITPLIGSILVLPEITGIEPKDLNSLPPIRGVCSDYVGRFKDC